MKRQLLALLLCAWAAGVAAGPLTVRGADGSRWRINDDDEPIQLERNLPNGTPDTSFGRNGRQALDFGGKDVDVTALRVDTAGHIWLAGTTTTGGVSGPIVQRLQPNGMLDTTWAVGGRTTAGPVGQRLIVEDMLPNADGSVWVAGNLIGSQGENDAGLWRLKPDGGLDYNFGVSGVWRRVGPDRSRARSLAAGPNGSLGFGVELLVARAGAMEIHELPANAKQPQLAPGNTAMPDDDDEAFVVWTGRGWAWRPGPQVAALTGLPVMAAGAPRVTPPTTASDAGHTALNPFAQADEAASSPAMPETPGDELPWGWLLAGLAGAGAMLFFWRRGANQPG